MDIRRESDSNGEFPDWLNLPWAVEKPSSKNKIDEWLKLWNKFLRDTLSKNNIYSIYVNELQQRDFFIKLSQENLREILNYAVSMGDGQWLNPEKTHFFYLISPMEKLAEQFHKKTIGSAAGSKPIGLYQLESDPEFHDFPRKIHKQILQILVANDLARWWPGKNSLYVELKGPFPYKKEKKRFFGKSRLEVIGDSQAQIDQMRYQNESMISEIDKLDSEIARLVDIGDEKSENDARILARRVESLEQMKGGLDNKINSLDLTMQTLISIEIDKAIGPILNQARQLQNEARKVINNLQKNVEAVIEGRIELASIQPMYEMLAVSPTVSESKVDERLNKHRKEKVSARVKTKVVEKEKDEEKDREKVKI